MSNDNYIINSITGAQMYSKKPVNDKTQSRNNLIKVRDYLENCIAFGIIPDINFVLLETEEVINLL